MKLGVLPLILGIVVAAVRLTGANAVADVLACIYLIVATMSAAEFRAARRV
jgi:hypothetical protein